MTSIAKALVVLGQLSLLAIGCHGCSQGHNVFAWCIVVSILTTTKEVSQ
jgi:hypothetical protein